jgi:PAS domain S-box-containing protein
MAAPNALDFELFFELTHDLLCIAGYDGYFKRVNPAVCKVLGYTEAELMASPIHSFIHPDDKVRTAENRSQLINEIPLLNFENRYLRKDGEAVWLSWTSIPVSKDQLVYAIAKNVSHKKSLEEERIQVITNLTTINQDLQLLTQSTSHDLRTPVNNLLAVFSLLDVSKIEDVETLEFIDILRTASESLKDKLNFYVDNLSKKDALVISIEELSFETSLKEVLVSLRSLLESTASKISYDFTQVPIILFNKAYLQSIFLNFISNSIKYARPGVPPVISIISCEVNGVKQLVYTDQGQGFDMSKVGDKIFGLHQKFHNGKDSKGIGLYLVREQIARLGGSINVESKPNAGATFTICFKK